MPELPPPPPPPQHTYTRYNIQHGWAATVGGAQSLPRAQSRNYGMRRKVNYTNDVIVAANRELHATDEWAGISGR